MHNKFGKEMMESYPVVMLRISRFSGVCIYGLVG